MEKGERMHRWRLLASFACGFAPIFVITEGLWEGSSVGSIVLVGFFAHFIGIPLCMLFAQQDGIAVQKGQNR